MSGNNWFKNNWLTRKWNERQERIAEEKRLRAHFSEQYEAINAAITECDPEAIEQAIENTEQLDKFIENYYSIFLKNALGKDNVETFKTVLALNASASVNYTFVSSSSGHDPDMVYSSRQEKPLLIVAIQTQKENIATYLAKHPDIDLSAVSSDYSFLISEGQKKESTTYSEKASAEAAKHGLSDVASILLTREANALKQQALQMSTKLSVK
ncbi:MAG: hypothetical protein NZ828_01945 [Alphaproteobacteria bacterium]|nr:hypothetical protein [Alphaproteobacteria bacterium]